MLCRSYATVLRDSPRQNDGGDMWCPQWHVVQKELSVIRRRSFDDDAPQIKASSISTADANATGGDRSKVHPADKYIEEGLATSVIDVSRAPSAMDPEVNDVAVDEA